MPGQTRSSKEPLRTMTLPFNGGPDNCPARRARSVISRYPKIVLQWRAGQLPGQTRGLNVNPGKVDYLQWRAGQLPGQTAGMERQKSYSYNLQWRAGQLPGQTPGNLGLRRSHSRPSMEGRTIARPDELEQHPIGSILPAFNGGPDNCPARRVSAPRRQVPECALQWRAGQLPGQTRLIGGAHANSIWPSMEGRTIARPDPRQMFVPASCQSPSMEGRTIARPD